MAGYTFDDFPSIEASFVEKGYQWVGTQFLTKFAFVNGQFVAVPNGNREDAMEAKSQELKLIAPEGYNFKLVSVLMTGHQGQQRLAFFAKAYLKTAIV